MLKFHFDSNLLKHFVKNSNYLTNMQVTAMPFFFESVKMGIPDQGGFWDLFSVTESISDRVCRDQIGTSLPCTMLHSQCNILNVTINSVSYFYICL